MRRELLQFCIALCLGILSICHLSSAQAQTQDADLAQRALITAQKLEKSANYKDSEVTELISSSKTKQHIYQRLKIMDGFDGSGTSDFGINLESYHSFAVSAGNQPDIELAQFYQALHSLYNPYVESTENDLEATFSFLEGEASRDNWLIAHSANSILGVLSGNNRDFVKAVNYASAGLAIIPQDQSFDAQVSRYYSYFLTSYLHGSTKNADLFLSSIDNLIDTAIKIGRPVESISLLNNLIYAMREVDDPDVIRQLVDILLRVGEKHPSETPGLVEMRASGALIGIGDFNRALPITQRGLELSENAAISAYLAIWEIQSLAATGDTQSAAAKLSKLETDIPQSKRGEAVENAILKAQALIAMGEGDASATFKYMDRHAELSVQTILNSNNADTATLLANLENDKARQSEREAAREEMFRLKQEALEQRVKSFQRGIVLLFLLAGAALAIAAFMAYRSRIATRLALSAEAALAGEKAKTQFLAVISHELRTPLNGIIGIADLLCRTAPSEQLRNSIGIINKSGQDLLRLVEEILDMSRIEANELQVFPETSDVRELFSGAEALWRPILEDKGIKFTAFISDDVPHSLKFDPLRLRQCVNNLLSNSAKFTKSGRVHMHVTAEPIKGRPQNEPQTVLRIIVADTGMGMSQEVIGNLFRPFVQADNSITRQYGGSGLGLAITRSLARLMGGDVNVISRQGAGSEFTLTLICDLAQDSIEGQDGPDQDEAVLDEMSAVMAQLPETPAHPEVAAQVTPALNSNSIGDEDLAGLFDDEPEGAPQSFTQQQDIVPLGENKLMAQNAQPESLKGLRVLIVEDVLSNQDVLKIFLEPEGCEITCASNGYEALSAVETRGFDVILMDIRMPEMDGIEATRQLRAKAGSSASVPIIALTADATADTNAQCMAAGANIFLTKPVTSNELLDAVRFVRRQSHSRVQDSPETLSQAAARLSA